MLNKCGKIHYVIYKEIEIRKQFMMNKLNTFLTTFGFSNSITNRNMYYLYYNEEFSIFILYMDNILIANNNLKLFDTIKQ